MCTTRHKEKVSTINGYLKEGNAAAVLDIERWNTGFLGPDKIMARQTAEKRDFAVNAPIYVFDTWAMTPDSKCGSYEDWVHHPKLVYEQIEEWMMSALGCTCSLKKVKLQRKGA